MKLDPGMHIGLHLVFFGKSGKTKVGQILFIKHLVTRCKFILSHFGIHKTSHLKNPQETMILFHL
jgi:hypothetical protein